MLPFAEARLPETSFAYEIPVPRRAIRDDASKRVRGFRVHENTYFRPLGAYNIHDKLVLYNELYRLDSVFCNDCFFFSIRASLML